MNIIHSNKKRVIVGLGATGLSCLKYFDGLGLPVSLIDTRDHPPGIDEFQEKYDFVPAHFGSWNEQLLLDASVLYVNPGVALDEPALVAAKQNGVEICGDIDLFCESDVVKDAKIIAITGSNGKSTVTTLVGEMAKEAGLAVKIGGNLGEPALNLIEENIDLYVLELSSFQLERCHQLKADVACVLNITADHMDRHKTLSDYHQAKQKIYQQAKCAVYNRNDALTQPLLAVNQKTLSFSESEPDLNQYGLRVIDGQQCICKGFEVVLTAAEVGIIGTHNLSNIAAALAIGELAGIPLSAMVKAAKRYSGLAHRCELVSLVNGVSWINDSKATNEGASIAAILSLHDQVQKTLVVILGGQAKGSQFNDVRHLFSGDALKGIAVEVLVMGQDATLIEQAIAHVVAVTRVDSLVEAVAIAATKTGRGDMVLLSPACASFDMFSGFEERGDCFKQAVSALGEESAQESLQ